MLSAQPALLIEWIARAIKLGGSTPRSSGTLLA